jgi:hypothetical protein
MSIFKKIFGRKKKRKFEDLEKELPPIPEEKKKKRVDEEKIHMDNVKARLDLILTELDNIKIQNKVMTERIKNMEKTLAEMKGIRYY